MWGLRKHLSWLLLTWLLKALLPTTLHLLHPLLLLHLLPYLLLLLHL
eukprot:COSAG02_NODE_11536_length_1703_cov_7.589776_2_plen_46_part_01